MSEQPTIRGLVLQTAIDATNHQRNSAYGDPTINLQCAGELKAIYAKYAGDKYCEGHDEAIELLLTKIGRIACGAPGHDDTYVDAAAYAAIAAECQTRHMLATANIAAGYAPTAPVDGDVWRTDTGDFGRVNGKTVLLVDPINADTALPPEPERHVEEHQPVKRDPIMPMIDADSPAKGFSDGRITFRLGSIVSFGKNTYPSAGGEIQEPLWCIIRISNGDFGEFTAQHESNGQQYKGLARHIHKVVTY